MKRRDILQSIAAAGTFSLIGCVTSDVGDTPLDTGTAPDKTSVDSPTARESRDTIHSPTTTLSETSTETVPTTSLTSNKPILIGDRLTVTASTCGNLTHDATISFHEQNLEVLITGTIPGKNGCYTANIEKISYVAAGDRLTVVIESDLDTDETKVCTQCIVELDYKATATFEESLPREVVVKHHAMGELTVVTTDSR